MSGVRDLARMLRISSSANPLVTTLTLVLVVVQSLAAVGLALVQRVVVDSAGLSLSTALVVAVAAGAVLYAANSTGGRIENVLRMQLSEQVDVAIHDDILRATSSIPTIDHLASPEYLDRMRVLRHGTMALASSAWAFARTAASAISLVASFLLLGAVHPLLGLLVGFAVVPIAAARRGQRTLSAVVDGAAGSVRLEEALHRFCIEPEPGMELRIHRNGHQLNDTAFQHWRAASDAEDRTRLRGALVEVASWFLFGAGMVLALGLTTSEIAAGRATLGNLIMVLFLIGQLSTQVGLAAAGVAALGEARHAAGHYWHVMNHAARVATTSSPSVDDLFEGLAVEDVSFRYPGAREDSLTGVSLHLPPGVTLGVAGENGSGKSTFIKLLTGMHTPTSGRITVNGTDLDDVDAQSWKAVSTGAFQDFLRPQTTCREAVGIGDLPAIDDPRRVQDAVTRGGAVPLVDGLGSGLDTQLGTFFGGVDLSRGQWQRLALARACMRQNPLLRVFDEPSASLDAAAERDFFDTVHEQVVGEDRTSSITVLVSHKLASMHMADVIAFFAHGTLLELGSHAELVEAGGAYAEFYALQAAGYRQ